VSTGTDAHHHFLNRKFFANLDGLRGVSILLVVLHHSAPFPEGPIRTVQENGSFGVPFFFTISGFLIISLMLREESAFGRVSLRKFYGRRSIRLLPLYYVVFAAYCVLILGLGTSSAEDTAVFKARLLPYFAYYSNVVQPIFGPFSHAWSLAFEEQFYLLFGFLMRFLPRRILVVAVAVAAMVYLALALPLGDGAITLIKRLLFFPPALFQGVVLAFALASTTGFRRLHPRLAPRWVAPVFFAACMSILFFNGLANDDRMRTLLSLVITITIGSAVLNETIPILGGRLLSYVGRVSYGMYLQHVLCKQLLMRATGLGDPVLVFLGSSALSFAVAHFSYQYFELPLMRRWRRQLTPEP